MSEGNGSNGDVGCILICWILILAILLSGKTAIVVTTPAMTLIVPSVPPTTVSDK